MLLGQWRASMPLHIETVEIPNSQTDRLWKIGQLYLNSLYCWSLALVYVFRKLFKKLRWTQKPRFHIRIYLRPCVNNILKNLFPVKLERTCFCQNSGKIPLKSPSKYHKCPIVHSKTYMKGNAKHHDMV